GAVRRPARGRLAGACACARAGRRPSRRHERVGDGLPRGRIIRHIAVRPPWRQEMPRGHRGKGRNRRNAQFFRLPPLAPHDSIRGVASPKEFRAVRPPMPFGGADRRCLS
ncbi:hypothetical protein, partial [Burkholderia diffusa]|uniref:hypothetical protein n=1 Tax=Burkholderia diffusa TaxID=488732 RepID=UPI001BAB7186